MNKYIKYLIESFIDDDEEEIYDDGMQDKVDAIDVLKFLDDVVKALMRLYSVLIEDRYQEDFPKFKKDPNNPSKSYVLPMHFYGSNVYGVRNRKKYTLDFFYKFTLLNNLDGTYDLIMNRNPDKLNMIFNEDWLNFLNSGLLKIRNFGYRDGNGKILDVKIPKLLVFSPNGKFTEQMVENFPEHIMHGPSEECAPVKLYSYRFETKNDFYTLAKKLVFSGYTVLDEVNSIYNKDTFDDSVQTLEDIEKQKEQEKENKILKSTDFILNQFASRDQLIIKLSIANINNKGKKPYIYSLNSSKNNSKKTGKLTALYTFKLILLDNNALIALLNDFNSFLPNNNDDDNVDIKEPNDLFKVLLFKTIQNAHKLRLSRYGLKSYDDNTNYRECFYGAEKEWAGGYYTKKLDMNDIPLGLGKFDMLYDFYYVIAYTIENIKGMKNFDKQSIITYTNNIEPNMDNFNFKSLNDTILNIMQLLN